MLLMMPMISLQHIIGIDKRIGVWAILNWFSLWIVLLMYRNFTHFVLSDSFIDYRSFSADTDSPIILAAQEKETFVHD